MGLGEWLLKKAGYAGYGVVPYLDLDILGVLGLDDLPLVEPIEIGDLSTFQKLLLIPLVLIPYFDLEWFKFFGLNPLNTGSEEPELDLGQGASYSPGNSGSGGGSSVLKYVMLGIPALIVFFLAFGFVTGSGYADLAANEAGFQLVGMNLDGPINSMREGVQTLQCFGNAACMRQWRFNNTQRPGSEEVGQDYSLKVEDFSVNDGFPLDVANRRASDRLPVGFSVYNPRHGLKGITARGVNYRVKMFDSSFGSNTVCETDWTSLGGEYAGSSDGQGVIMPGGFATPLETHESLTLRECELLQPALGIKRKVTLQVRYNYSSQSTLYVDAMSRENMRSLGERPEFKKSETANTPVKTYVNVESPVTYRVNEDTGQAESSIFRVKLGFETGQDDVHYKVNVEDFKFYDSSKTVDVAERSDVGSAECNDLQRNDGDEYTFSSEMGEYLTSRQNNSWFESDSGPSPAQCSMVIEDPGSISPTGETLTMRVDANYTVMLEEDVTGFEAQNSRCTEYNCPLLVPERVRQDNGAESLISECRSRVRVDANDGCNVRKGADNDDWRSVTKINEYDTKIEEGETAYLWSNFKSEYLSPQGIFEDSMLSEQAVGFDQRTLDKIEENNRIGAIVGTRTRSGGNDLEFEPINVALCNDYTRSEMLDIWKKRQSYEDAPYFNPVTASCGQDGLGDLYLEFATYTLYQSPSERYNSAKNDCEGVVVATSSGFQCWSSD